MESLTEKQVRGLHVRSSIISGIVAGLGVAAGIALLVLIAASVSFSHNRPNDGQILQDVAIATGMFGGGAAAIVMTVGVLLHLLAGAISPTTTGASSVISTLLALIAGAAAGTGLWVWQLLILAERSMLGLHVAATLGTFLFVFSFWTLMAMALRVRATETGKKLTFKLASYAAVASLFPWAYMVLAILIRQ